MRVPSIDLHADTLMAVVHEGHDLAGTTPDLGELDVPRMRRGGLDAQFFSIFVTPYWRGEAAAGRAFDLITRLQVELARPEASPQIVPATTVTEISLAVENERRAALMGIEGAHALGGSLERVDEFAALGVRYLTLTWANANEFADSAGSPTVHGGLSPLGRRLVRRLEDTGVLVDVSHVADSTFWAVVESASRPFIASHSSCRALCPDGRNLSDEMLRAIAAARGVVGINFHSGFLDQDWSSPGWSAPWRRGADVEDALAAEHDDRYSRPPMPSGRASLDQLVEHILHALEVAGPEHVGLGSDFDGKIVPPTELEDVGRLPALRLALANRGVDRMTLEGIWGGNATRVLGEADEIWSRVFRGTFPSEPIQ